MVALGKGKKKSKNDSVNDLMHNQTWPNYIKKKKKDKLEKPWDNDNFATQELLLERH